MQPMRYYVAFLSIALTGSCLLLAPKAHAVPVVCDSIFKATTVANLKVSGEWRKTNGSFFSAVRANAPHNWAYFKAIKPRLTYLKDAFQIEGVGIGDFHILNIGDIEIANGKRKIGLVDLDDGGSTSLFADFTRSVISNQASPYKVPLKDLWESYLSGLLGHKLDKPKVIAETLSKSHDEYLDLQKETLKKLTDGDQFSALAGLQAIKYADKLTQKIYADSLLAFKAELKDSKILDQGFKIKETGGSQGAPRFWFLISKNNTKSIIEFKTLTAPAMAFYKKQGPQQERIKSLIEVYRPQKSSYGIYKFVDGGNYKFIARERLKSFLNLDPESTDISKDSISEGKTIYLYLAQRAGVWHAEQGQGKALSEALTVQEKKSFQEFENLVNDYMALMKQEAGL